MIHTYLVGTLAGLGNLKKAKSFDVNFTRNRKNFCGTAERTSTIFDFFKEICTILERKKIYFPISQGHCWQQNVAQKEWG